MKFSFDFVYYLHVIITLVKVVFELQNLMNKLFHNVHVVLLCQIYFVLVSLFYLKEIRSITY